MRLWHKDLIPVLPRQQLLGQWRECCLIAKSLAETGTPNHLLVNKITDYEPKHFYNYCRLVCEEMQQRGYKVNAQAVQLWLDMITDCSHEFVPNDELFFGWHTDEYLKICYYNLKEKFLCGGIPYSEWNGLSTYVVTALGVTL